jgi:hypothetical protein
VPASHRPQDHLHNNAPLFGTTTIIVIFLALVRLFVHTSSLSHLLTLNLNPAFVIIACAFVAVHAFIIATILDALEHASETLVTFTLFLFLSLAGIVIVTFWVILIVLSGFELGFSLCET